jgi:hypothetical protein
MRSLTVWVALFVILVSVSYESVVTVFSTRSKMAVNDLRWGIVFALLILAATAFFWLRRGRLLIVISALATILLLGLTALRAGTAPALVVLAWIVLLSLTLGHATLTWVAPAVQPGGTDGLLLGVGIGLGELAFLVMGLGLLHAYYPWVMWTFLALLTLLGAPWFIRRLLPDLRRLAAHAREAWRSADLRLPGLVFGLLVICAVGALTWALVPAVQWDALNYHLGIPAIYVRQHALLAAPEEFRSYWAHTGEMLYTLALLTAGQPLPGLIHFTFGLMSAGLAYLFGKKLAGPHVGLLTALFFYSLPITADLSGMAYVDLMVTFFCFGAVYAAVMWWLEDKSAWFIVCGILAGLALSVKLTAVLILAPLAVLFVLIILWRRRVSLSALAAIALLGAPCLLLAAPWLIRDWAWTGNPIFPWFNNLFHSPLWPVANSTFDFARYGLGTHLLNFLRLPYDMTVHSQAYSEGPDGLFGAVLLVGLPWFLFLKTDFLGKISLKRLAVGLAALVLAGTFIWFHVAQYFRYYLPMLPILAFFAALNIEVLWRFLAARKLAKAYAILGMCLLAGYLLSTRVTSAVWFWQIPERYPLKLLTGIETQSDFLSRAVPSYAAFRFLETQPPREKSVLSLAVPLRLYTDATLHEAYGDGFTADWLVSFKPDAHLAQALLAKGYQFILLDANEIQLHPEYKRFPVAKAAFLAQYAHLIFSQNQVSIFALDGSFPPAN